MSKRSFVIISEAVRERAIEWLRQLPLKSVVRTDDKPTRSGAQNDRFHAMLDDVAAQIGWTDVFGRPIRMSRENWKRFFLRMYNRSDGKPFPSLFLPFMCFNSSKPQANEMNPQIQPNTPHTFTSKPAFALNVTILQANPLLR